jgi:hypothetical protein
MFSFECSKASKSMSCGVDDDDDDDGSMVSWVEDVGNHDSE